MHFYYSRCHHRAKNQRRNSMGWGPASPTAVPQAAVLLHLAHFAVSRFHCLSVGHFCNWPQIPKESTLRAPAARPFLKSSPGTGPCPRAACGQDLPADNPHVSHVWSERLTRGVTREEGRARQSFSETAGQQAPKAWSLFLAGSARTMFRFTSPPAPGLSQKLGQTGGPWKARTLVPQMFLIKMYF